MATKIRLKPRLVGLQYPVTYQVDFTQPPTERQIDIKKKLVQKVLNDDKDKKIKAGLATKNFRLDFDWTKTSRDPVTFKLFVDAVKDKRFRKPTQGEDQNQGQDVPPTPKKPTPPPL